MDFIINVQKPVEEDLEVTITYRTKKVYDVLNSKKFMTIVNICDKAGVGRRQAVASLDELEKFGLVVKERREWRESYWYRKTQDKERRIIIRDIRD